MKVLVRATIAFGMLVAACARLDVSEIATREQYGPFAEPDESGMAVVSKLPEKELRATVIGTVEIEADGFVAFVEAWQRDFGPGATFSKLDPTADPEHATQRLIDLLIEKGPAALKALRQAEAELAPKPAAGADLVGLGRAVAPEVFDAQPVARKSPELSLFRWSAHDSNNKPRSGELRGESAAAIADRLRRQGFSGATVAPV